jgi:hypothetical protein
VNFPMFRRNIGPFIGGPVHHERNFGSIRPKNCNPPPPRERTEEGDGTSTFKGGSNIRLTAAGRHRALHDRNNLRALRGGASLSFPSLAPATREELYAFRPQCSPSLRERSKGTYPQA